MKTQQVINEIDSELENPKYLIIPKIRQMLVDIRGKILNKQKLSSSDLFTLKMQGIDIN